MLSTARTGVGFFGVCLVGTAGELVERIRGLERDGLQEMIFAAANETKWRLAEEFARRVMPRL